MGRPEMVRRERLLRDLATTAVDVPLVLVTGPAGYGKTTMLRQWAADDRRPFAWVHIDENDNDPIRLLRHIALALHRIRPLNYAVWRALDVPHPSDVGVALPRLLAAAAVAVRPWVLVLDDMHVLRPNIGTEAVVAFADGLPAGCQVVVSGRNRPGLRLGGLRSRGKCVEFGPRELAFTAEEVRAVLTTAGVRAADSGVHDLLRRTEGWPAGVYLAVRSTWRGAGADAVGSMVSGSTTEISDYLHEEVLLHESAEVVRFLLRTAPLDRMSGPLCDAVLGATDSGARLAELHTRNLFLSRVDADGHWYRYHPMFTEMLLAELRRSEPVEEARAHRRAAGWFEEHGEPEPAVSHALAARDTATAARLVSTYAPRLVDAGRFDAVRGWLGSLADGALEDHPHLAVVAGWTWALTGDAARAQKCLHAAQRGAHATTAGNGIDDGTPAGGSALASGIALLRAALAPNGVGGMLVDARQALDLEPPGGACYPAAASLLGTAQMLNGDPEAAIGVLERAAHFGREQQRSVASFALAQLSLIAAERDDWTAAESYAVEAAELVVAGNLTHCLSSIATLVAQANVALHRRDVQLARHSTGMALRLYAEPSPAAFPWLAAQMAIALGRFLLELDDYPAARLKMTEARRHLARLSTGGVLGRQHQELAEDVARYGDRTPSAGAMTLTGAEVRVLQLLPTHLTLSEIADALFISRNTVKTQVSSIYAKLLASSRAEAVRAARSRGLVD